MAAHVSGEGQLTARSCFLTDIVNENPHFGLLALPEPNALVKRAGYVAGSAPSNPIPTVATNKSLFNLVKIVVPEYVATKGAARAPQDGAHAA